MSDKSYLKYSIAENPIIFRGVVSTENGDLYKVDSDILRKLAKDLGFSYDLYNTLVDVSQELADSLVASMSVKSGRPEVTLLLSTQEASVLGYNLDVERTPLLNDEFLKTVRSLSETSDAIKIAEVYHNDSDQISTVIVKKVDPVRVEETYISGPNKEYNYDIGIILVNDELNNVYTRLVVYVNNHPFYLPSTYYSATNTRYNRTTSNSRESLEVLMLKIIEDLRENALMDKLRDFHYIYRTNKDIAISYEEYNAVVNTMRKIPTIIEDQTLMNSLTAKYERFDELYAQIDDNKSSYIWRCTATSDITVGSLLLLTSNILNDIYAPAIECMKIRELLGSYLCTKRIAEEIAKEYT